MAIWQCSSCGTIKESRCKPKKCPQCNSENTMIKKEGVTTKEEACTSKRTCKKRKS
ncbi:MAG: DNA repair protein RadA [Thermodesulfobacteriaceae bacterium]|nr:DNA repair protein RadA [Thermodesulfobacteriaceae bacterium]MDW8136548.1 hypothetical protein [Thermodesulfobacterium sp.]